MENLTPGFHAVASDGLFSNKKWSKSWTKSLLLPLQGEYLHLNQYHQQCSKILQSVSSYSHLIIDLQPQILLEQPVCLGIIVFVGLALQSWNSDSSMPLLGNAYLASYREQLLEDIMAAKTGKSFVIHEYAGLLLWVARM